MPLTIIGIAIACFITTSAMATSQRTLLRNVDG
jgi:hypothetical protein